MTILEPNKQKSRNRLVRGAITIAIIVVSTGTWIGISFYNETVDLQHRIAEAERSVEKLTAANADLRERIYSFTEIERIKAVADKAGLIPERNPQYFTLDAASIARQ